MNKISRAFALFALAGGLATPAMAVDQNIDLSATVASFCRIAGSFTPADDSAVINVTNGAIVTTPIPKSYNVVCNGPSTTTLVSNNGGLSGPPAAPGFENVINYTASASNFVTIAAGTTANGAVGANETLGTATRATPGSTDIDVVITPLANTDPLAVGNYNDRLVVRIVPN